VLGVQRTLVLPDALLSTLNFILLSTSRGGTGSCSITRRIVSSAVLARKGGWPVSNS